MDAIYKLETIDVPIKELIRSKAGVLVRKMADSSKDNQVPAILQKRAGLIAERWTEKILKERRMEEQSRRNTASGYSSKGSCRSNRTSQTIKGAWRWRKLKGCRVGFSERRMSIEERMCLASVLGVSRLLVMLRLVVTAAEKTSYSVWCCDALCWFCYCCI